MRVIILVYFKLYNKYINFYTEKLTYIRREVSVVDENGFASLMMNHFINMMYSLGGVSSRAVHCLKFTAIKVSYIFVE